MGGVDAFQSTVDEKGLRPERMGFFDCWFRGRSNVGVQGNALGVGEVAYIWSHLRLATPVIEKNVTFSVRRTKGLKLIDDPPSNSPQAQDTRGLNTENTSALEHDALRYREAHLSLEKSLRV